MTYTTKIHTAFPQMFADSAARFPQNLALQFQDHQLCYADLNKQVNQLAHWFLSFGIQKGDPLIVMLDRSHELIIVMLAVMKIGAIYIPVSPSYPDDRLETMIEDSKAKFVLADESSRKFSIKTLALSLFWQNAKNYSVENPNIDIALSDLAYIIYTSGSTGKPKGVMIAYKSITNIIKWYHEFFQITSADIASQINNQAFDVFFSDTLPYLSCGAAVKIVTDDIRIDPAKLLAWLSSNTNITIADIPTAYAQVLFDLTWPQDNSLRILKIGGEYLGKRPHQQFNFKIYNMYGPTENTIETTCACIYDPSAHQSEDTQSYIPIGKPVANTLLYVVDQDLRLVQEGECGELLIGGAGLSLGYLNNPEMTAKKFIPNPFADSILDDDDACNSKVYRSGDLVRMRQDGNYEFVGRVDNQVKISGHRIELEEIENILLENAEVQQVAVTVHKYDDQSHYLVGHIVPQTEKLRIPVDITCKVKIAEKEFDMIIEDICDKGVSLRTNCSVIQDLMEQTTILFITFQLKEIVSPLTLRAKKIWQAEMRCGLEFISDNDENVLASLHDQIDDLRTHNNCLHNITAKTGHRNLWKSLLRKLPLYMIPTRLICLDKFTFTPNGKIDRKCLAASVNDSQFADNKKSDLTATDSDSDSTQHATDNVQNIILEIWREVLKNNNIKVQDNFFDIGGQSIAMMRVQIKLQKTLQRKVDIVDLFTYPTVETLAQFLKHKHAAPERSSRIRLYDRGNEQRQVLRQFKNRIGRRAR